jgi:hypothetical protein
LAYVSEYEKEIVKQNYLEEEKFISSPEGI